MTTNNRKCPGLRRRGTLTGLAAILILSLALTLPYPLRPVVSIVQVPDRLAHASQALEHAGILSSFAIGGRKLYCMLDLEQAGHVVVALMEDRGTHVSRLATYRVDQAGAVCRSLLDAAGEERWSCALRLK